MRKKQLVGYTLIFLLALGLVIPLIPAFGVTSYSTGGDGSASGAWEDYDFYESNDVDSETVPSWMSETETQRTPYDTASSNYKGARFEVPTAIRNAGVLFVNFSFYATTGDFTVNTFRFIDSSENTLFEETTFSVSAGAGWKTIDFTDWSGCPYQIEIQWTDWEGINRDDPNNTYDDEFYDGATWTDTNDLCFKIAYVADYGYQESFVAKDEWSTYYITLTTDGDIATLTGQDYTTRYISQTRDLVDFSVYQFMAISITETNVTVTLRIRHSGSTYLYIASNLGAGTHYFNTEEVYSGQIDMLLIYITGSDPGDYAKIDYIRFYRFHEWTDASTSGDKDNYAYEDSSDLVVVLDASQYLNLTDDITDFNTDDYPYCRLDTSAGTVGVTLIDSGDAELETKNFTTSTDTQQFSVSLAVDEIRLQIYDDCTIDFITFSVGEINVTSATVSPNEGTYLSPDQTFSVSNIVAYWDDGTSISSTDISYILKENSTQLEFTGYALEFDGSGDRINLDSPMTDSPYWQRGTFSAWVEVAQDVVVDNDGMTFFSTQQTGTDAIYFAYRTAVSGERFYMYAWSVGWYSTKGFSSVQTCRGDGTLHHICYTWDADREDSLVIYLDNVDITDPTYGVSPSGTMADAGDDCTIGSRESGLSFIDDWEGKIENVTYYSKEFSASEIADLYNGELPMDDLELFFPLDEGTGSTTTNYGLTDDGADTETITGNPAWVENEYEWTDTTFTVDVQLWNTTYPIEVAWCNDTRYRYWVVGETYDFWMIGTQVTGNFYYDVQRIADVNYIITFYQTGQLKWLNDSIITTQPEVYSYLNTTENGYRVLGDDAWLPDGVYPVSVTNTQGQYETTFKFNLTTGDFWEEFYSQAITPIDEVESHLVFSFYSNLDSLGLPDKLLKIYVDGTRVHHMEHWSAGNTINLTITDYHNHEVEWAVDGMVYPDYEFTPGDIVFIDLGLDFYPLQFSNPGDYPLIVEITSNEVSTNYTAPPKGVTPEHRTAAGGYTVKTWWYHHSEGGEGETRYYEWESEGQTVTVTSETYNFGLRGIYDPEPTAPSGGDGLQFWHVLLFGGIAFGGAVVVGGIVRSVRKKEEQAPMVPPESYEKYGNYKTQEDAYVASQRDARKQRQKAIDEFKKRTKRRK